MFFTSCIGFVLSSCGNVKKCMWNTKYIVQHSIECLQAIKSIQYTIHDTKSCELPKYILMYIQCCKIEILKWYCTMIEKVLF